MPTSNRFYRRPPHLQARQQWMVAAGMASLVCMALVALQLLPANGWMLVSTLLGLGFSIAGFAWSTYSGRHPGIQNDGVWFSSLSSRGWLAWLVAAFLTFFYCVLYWKGEWLGLRADGNVGLVGLFDPLSYGLKGQPASQWFVYGVLYTLAITAFGFKFILKYRHNRYQVLRTLSTVFFQLAFAFLLPEFFMRMNLPYNDLKNMWPLNYSFFDAWNLDALQAAGWAGKFFLIFGLLMIFAISPTLCFFFGKRWYCSWVCGCGGLAETAGDPFRQLSSKSTRAWQIEQWLIYPIFLFAVAMTLGVLYSYFTGQAHLMGISTAALRAWYGFAIGAAFSGVIGVGFYPLLGSRVWCRFGCPMAALLGIQQKFFSRFRITTNGGQCISCGNCSSYCEMGIDVRAYAQRGQPIVRASCVGCGICAAVCPRGVLRLENGPHPNRESSSPLASSFLNAPFESPKDA
ncbi:MAG: 4Fe-4S binding protein [Saprospiraceae bacterium]|nr:4Fe-4S binding protein [Saprospiraceae bacterium]